MDQQKVGEFLKTLRKEKNLTQEDLADKMNVSRRTVSRWETGNNLPDLALLVELADFYGVDMREIFNGERKTETMDKDLKETMLMAATAVSPYCLESMFKRIVAILASPCRAKDGNPVATIFPRTFTFFV